VERSAHIPRRLRFGAFEIDLQAGELWKAGRKRKLTGQPFSVLAILLERPGEVINREELQKRLWPDTFVDVDHNLNAAINKIREALGDSSEHPRFVETLSRRGYRFIAPVESVNPAPAIPASSAALEAAGTDGKLALPSAPAAGADREQPAVSRIPKKGSAFVWVASAVAALLVLLVAALGFGAYRYWHRGEGFNLQNMQVTRLTDNGKANLLAISPDGRYVAWVIRNGDDESLWVRQVATGSDIQLLPPAATLFVGLDFSPDGNYLYFTRAVKNNNNVHSLFQIPSLGGTAVQLAFDVDTGVSFSPDGKHMSYLRGAVPAGTVNVIISNPDGTKERRVATFVALNEMGFFSAPAWSSDGRNIAFSMVEQNKGLRSVIKIVSPTDGRTRDLLVEPFGVRLGQPVWLPDGRGLLIPMRQAAPGSRGQIWFISFPEGKLRRFTNDPTDYDICCMGLTADGKTLAVMQNQVTANLWVADSGKLDQARQITSGEPYPSASWASNDQILTEDPDGQFQMVSSSSGSATHLIFQQLPSGVPSPCGGGRYLVYAAFSGVGSDIWRSDRDGRNPVQLTHTGIAFDPICSPDGKWIAYSLADVSRAEGSTGKLMRLSIQGGEPLLLSKRIEGANPNPVSPDSRMVAVAMWPTADGYNHLKVFALDTGKPLYTFQQPHPGTLVFQWSPDGRALDYVMTANGVGNIWRQPLAGGAPIQLTHFNSEQISSFDWSPDGKQLLLSRGYTYRNVFLISNFR